jgi:transposase
MKTRSGSPLHDQFEWRRLRAWALHQEGWTGQRIAAALGVTAGAVSQWLKRARAGGADTLQRRLAPGPTRRLTVDQREHLPTLLAHGAEAYGFLGDVWTTPRIATVIQREFGVKYHPAHVGRLLRGLGWSPQIPRERARQRDEAAIAAWTAEQWPALKKKPRPKDAPSSG